MSKGIYWADTATISKDKNGKYVFNVTKGELVANHYLEIYSGKKLISRKKLENMSKPQREDLLEKEKFKDRSKTVKLKRSGKELKCDTE